LKVSPLARHERQRQHRVADDRDEQRPSCGTLHDELEPHDEHKARHRRPALECSRVLDRLEASNAGATHCPRASIVQGRERVQPLPDGADEGRNDRHPNPRVDPHEQRSDVRVRRSAADALGEDPEEAGNTHDAHQQLHDPRQLKRVSGDGRRIGAQVANQHERERKRNRESRAAEIDDQRQPALVVAVDRVRSDDVRRRE
jgi:hypothetical protein